jgi:hypothetical protein
VRGEGDALAGSSWQFPERTLALSSCRIFVITFVRIAFRLPSAQLSRRALSALSASAQAGVTNLASLPALRGAMAIVDELEWSLLAEAANPDLYSPISDRDGDAVACVDSTHISDIDEHCCMHLTRCAQFP